MWYYAIDGQTHGPLDEAALDQLIAWGTVTNDTLIWKEGMSTWQPAGQIRTVGSPLQPAIGTAPATCTMCGKNVGADNLIDLLGHRVCAACKPTVVQTLREGVVPVGATTGWRDGKKVVTYNGQSLPRRCYKCNHETAEAPLKRKLYWHPPVYYWLIALGIIVRLGILIYVIVAMVVRKRATVDIFLCRQHAQRRLYSIIGGWSGLALGIILLITGAVSKSGIEAMVGLSLLIASLFVFRIGAALNRAARIKDDVVWMNGAGKDFLASLPEWPQDGSPK